MKAISPRFRAKIAPEEPEWFDLAYAPLADGTLARMQANFDLNGIMADHQRRALAGENTGPYSPLQKESQARLSILDGASVSAGPAFELREKFPRFDQLFDGQWVLADARKFSTDANGRIIDANGKTLAEVDFGDAIEHLQTDVRGKIWVGYFDEGIFGDSLGASGLNCFNGDGTISWRNPGNGFEAIGQNFPVISDCEAMNVTGDAVWTCTYTDFPIARFGLNGNSKIWDNTKAGAHIIAVHQDLIVLLGGYPAFDSRPDERRHGVLLKLDDSRIQPVGEFELDIDTDDLKKLSLASSRGPLMHFIQGNSWYELSVQDIAEKLL